MCHLRPVKPDRKIRPCVSKADLYFLFLPPQVYCGLLLHAPTTPTQPLGPLQRPVRLVCGQLGGPPGLRHFQRRPELPILHHPVRRSTQHCGHLNSELRPETTGWNQSRPDWTRLDQQRPDLTEPTQSYPSVMLRCRLVASVAAPANNNNQGLHPGYTYPGNRVFVLWICTQSPPYSGYSDHGNSYGNCFLPTHPFVLSPVCELCV